MKKKIITSIILLGLLIVSLVGCKKEETPDPEDETVVEAEEIKDTTSYECSGCEEEKICGIYTVDEEQYFVCHDCSEEFISHHEEKLDKLTCQGCEEEKFCGTYMIDGKEYVVCQDDFEEFAVGMGLKEPDVIGDSIEPAKAEEKTDKKSEDKPAAKPETSKLPTCSLCEVEKECNTYSVEGKEYIVCSDCYNEFANAFGLDTKEEARYIMLECSLCEISQLCGVYGVEGEEYVVCPDCATEFMTAFSEKVSTHTCGSCELEKICGMYIVDGDSYFVCLDDFEEFVTGMGLQ